jgi:hypothetical protein
MSGLATYRDLTASEPSEPKDFCFDSWFPFATYAPFE